MSSHEERFSTWKDPRIINHRNKQHLLSDILVLTILAVICGADSWVDVENFAIIRHIALNLLKKETSLKSGIAAKRKKAGWCHRYLAKVLEGK